MNLMLSPQELEKVMLELKQIFPDREILQAYPSRLASGCWSGPDKVGKNKCDGKPISLETEVEVFHSMFDWKCGEEENTLIKYRPDWYQIWIEKKSKEKAHCAIVGKILEVGLPGTDANQEQREVVNAFSQAGIWPNINIHNTRSCSLVPENERKEYWQSDSLPHPDYRVSEIQAFSREDMKPGIELLLHPGFYPGNEQQFDFRASNANGTLLVREMDPLDGEGPYNNCKVCRGENYQGMEKVRFLVASDKLIPLTCEFCLDEYLSQVSRAFKR